MTKTVALSPSNQTANTWPDGTNEEQHAVELAGRVQVILESAGVTVKRADAVRPFGSDPCRIDYFLGADALIMLHTNAFDGKTRGMRLFCYQKYAGYGLLACENQKLMRSIQLEAELLNMKPDPKTYTDFAQWGELTNADRAGIPAVYVESIFHDNAEDVTWYYGHLDELARAIADGILNYFDMAAPEPPDEDDLPVYRIQLGAWHDRTLAEKALKSLQEAEELLRGAIIKED